MGVETFEGGAELLPAGRRDRLERWTAKWAPVRRGKPRPLKNLEQRAGSRKQPVALGLGEHERVRVTAGKTRPTAEEGLAKVRGVRKRMASLPTSMEGTDEEIIGYDEGGHLD